MVEGQPRLVPYDDRWPDLFNEVRDTLREALGHRILSVHHVGSTSVPGLVAKPILDILVGVSDLSAATECVGPLERVGFENGPEDDIPERLWFRGRNDGLRTHHLSLAEPTSAYFRDTLAFRDALRGSPRLAQAYADMKADLVRQHVPGSPFHTGKSEFIRKALRAHRSPRGP